MQAIALNGIGYNLTRAIGPALAGFLILLGGTGLAFSLYARVDPRGDRARWSTWRAQPPLHRPAARAPAVRDARRHALRPQHAGDPQRDDAHHRLFAALRRALGAAAAGGAPAAWPRRRHVRRDPGHDGRSAASPRACCCRWCAAGSAAAPSWSAAPCSPAPASRWSAPRITGCWPRSACCCSASAGPRPTRRSRRRRSLSARPGCGRGRWRSTSWRRTAR